MSEVRVAEFGWMVGHSIECGFHEPDWWIFSSESFGIGLATPWRLLEHGRNRVSFDDHGQWYGLPAPIDAAVQANELLAGALVQRVEVRPGTCDLILELERGLRLEILPFSLGYEGWNIWDPEGKTWIAQGGRITVH